MKKSIILSLTSIAFFALLISVLVSTNQIQAQTTSTVLCPEGYICKPIPSQPVGCPVGYMCYMDTINKPPVSNSLITVTSPNGGENLQEGQKYIIRWLTNNLTLTGKIMLTISNGKDILLSCPSNLIEYNLLPNTDSYQWTVHGNTKRGTDGAWGVGDSGIVNCGNTDFYNIKISYISQDGQEIASDFTDKPFTITSKPVPNPNPEPTPIPAPISSVYITSPIAGQVFNLGDTLNIKWVNKNAEGSRYHLFLVPQDGRPEISLISGAFSTTETSFSYLLREKYVSSTGATMRSQVLPGKYKVRVNCLGCAGSGQNSIAYSGLIKILPTNANPNPVPDPISSSSITVSTPNGGEILSMGSSRLINWSSPKSGDFKVDIKLSSESRDFLIAQSYAGNSYNWTVGSILEKLVLPIGQYKIKVCESGTDNCDSSDGSFNLDILAPTPVVNPPDDSITLDPDKNVNLETSVNVVPTKESISTWTSIKNFFGIGSK